MRQFRAEFNNNYFTYTFGYAEYAVMESKEEAHKLYRNGFLPYSADISLKYPVFYLARSLRVDTSIFSDSSENRRVNRKMDVYSPAINRIPITEHLTQNEFFFNFCLSYTQERFSNNAMYPERLRYIFSCGIATDVFSFTKENESEPFAYVLAIVDKDCLHFWFSFFDTEILKDIPVGKWLMWKMIKWAQQNSIKHVYLGTTYGEKSLYKVRDFSGLEFFDGTFWNENMKLLKDKCKTDSNLSDADIFKTSADANLFLEKLLTASDPE